MSKHRTTQQQLQDLPAPVLAKKQDWNSKKGINSRRDGCKDKQKEQAVGKKKGAINLRIRTTDK